MSLKTFVQQVAPVFALILLAPSGCRRHGAHGVPFEHSHELEFKPVANDAPAVNPAEVTIYDRIRDRPEGIRFSESGPLEKRAVVAPIYAHKVLGMIEMKERIDVPTSYGDVMNDEWHNPALRARREKVLSDEAARHGANSLYLINSIRDQRYDGQSQRRLYYWAIYLSPDPIKYPDVDTLLGKLELDKDGYVAGKRFTAKLQDLPNRAPETIQLERGHCYMFAIAFHPERIERPRNQVTSINFTIKLSTPAVFPGVPVIHAGSGGFSERHENKESFISSEFLDGVWSRTGAGTLACPVYKTQSAQLSFTTFEGSALKNPPAFAPGRGTADFVVYGRKLSTDEFANEACGRCVDVAHRCSYREPLASCAPLNTCLQTVGMPLGTCSERFR